MKNNKNRSLSKSKAIRMNGMVSINPVGFWSLSELCCNEASKSYK